MKPMQTQRRGRLMLIAGLLGAALGLRGGEEDTFRPEDVADMQNEIGRAHV